MRSLFGDQVKVTDVTPIEALAEFEKFERSLIEWWDKSAFVDSPDHLIIPPAQYAVMKRVLDPAVMRRWKAQRARRIARRITRKHR